MRGLRFVVFTYVYVVCVGISAFGGSFAQSKDDVKIQDVAVFMEEGSSACFSGDLILSEATSFSNHGRIWVSNLLPCTVNFYENNFGSGDLIFNGESDCEFFGQNVRIGRFIMDMDEAGLFLDGSLKVSEILNLNSGIIHVAEGSTFKIENALPEAVVFDNSILNGSYIDGKMIREVSAGENYCFPIGSNQSFHPFYISEAEQPESFGVTFRSDLFSQNESIIADPKIRAVEPGGWTVASESASGTKFKVWASLLNENQKSFGMDKYSIVYAAGDDFLFADYSLDLNVSRTNEFYLAGSVGMTDGLFGIGRQAAIELINFILIDGVSNSVFEVPNLSEYDYVEIKAFNHWGATVYSSNNYKNDWDLRNYPPGTYYYQMTLWTDNSPQIIQNIIEVKTGR